MKTIDRYIFRETAKIFILSVIALTTILFLDKILFLTELIINKGVSLGEVAWMMIYISPAFLALTIPMSVLVGAVVAFSNFSASSELIAMRASGWSFLRLLKPIFIFSLLTYAVTNYIMFYALPWGNLSFKKIIYEIVQERAHFDIKPNVFNRDFDNLILHVQERAGSNQLKKVFIADSTASEPAKIILAEEGDIAADAKSLRIQLNLRNGAIHDLGQKRQQYQIINFDRYDLTLELPRSQDLQRRALKGNRELSFIELTEKIEQMRKEGKPVNHELVELSKKFSLPFTCLLFGFVGAPLGVSSSRSGKSGSFAISVAAILLYYIGLISTQNLGSVGKIDPLLSVWIPNLLTMAAAFYLVYKIHRELPLKYFNFVEDLLLTLTQSVKNYYAKRAAATVRKRTQQPIEDRKRQHVDATARAILKEKMQRLNDPTRRP